MKPRRAAGLARLRRAGEVRNLIVEGIRERPDAGSGPQRAWGGRRHAAGQIRLGRDLLTRPDNTVSSMARLLGVSHAILCTYLPELTTRGRYTAGSGR